MTRFVIPPSHTAPMTTITVHTDDYNDVSISRLDLDGKPVWIAREIGRALGYARGGDKLARNISRRWTRDFTEGVDYDRLTGELLERLRNLVPRLRRTRRVMILTRSGLEKVLARSAFEIAAPLRVWIEARLPGLQPKVTEPPATIHDGDLLEERRLRLAERQESRLASEQRARGLLLLLDAISETASDDEQKVYQIKMAQELAGRDFTSLLPPKAESWQTPTEIANRNQVTTNRVGRIISQLGLRDPETQPDRVEAYDNLAPGTGRIVTCYRYSPEAVAEIQTELEPSS